MSRCVVNGLFAFIKGRGDEMRGGGEKGASIVCICWMHLPLLSFRGLQGEWTIMPTVSVVFSEGETFSGCCVGAQECGSCCVAIAGHRTVNWWCGASDVFVHHPRCVVLYRCRMCCVCLVVQKTDNSIPIAAAAREASYLCCPSAPFCLRAKGKMVYRFFLLLSRAEKWLS